MSSFSKDRSDLKDPVSPLEGAAGVSSANPRPRLRTRKIGEFQPRDLYGNFSFEREKSLLQKLEPRPSFVDVINAAANLSPTGSIVRSLLEVDPSEVRARGFMLKGEKDTEWESSFPQILREDLKKLEDEARILNYEEPSDKDKSWLMTAESEKEYAKRLNHILKNREVFRTLKAAPVGTISAAFLISAFEPQNLIPISLVGTATAAKGLIKGAKYGLGLSLIEEVALRQTDPNRTKRDLAFNAAISTILVGGIGGYLGKSNAAKTKLRGDIEKYFDDLEEAERTLVNTTDDIQLGPDVKGRLLTEEERLDFQSNSKTTDDIQKYFDDLEEPERTLVQQPEAGQPLTIFDPAGNAKKVEVVAVSDQGSVRVRLADGSETVLDIGAERSQNVADPSYRVAGTVLPEQQGRPVSELTDAELELVQRTAEERIAVHSEGGSRASAFFDALSDRNAALFELRRRQEDVTPVDTPEGEGPPPGFDDPMSQIGEIVEPTQVDSEFENLEIQGSGTNVVPKGFDPEAAPPGSDFVSGPFGKNKLLGKSVSNFSLLNRLLSSKYGHMRRLGTELFKHSYLTTRQTDLNQRSPVSLEEKIASRRISLIDAYHDDFYSGYMNYIGLDLSQRGEIESGKMGLFFERVKQVGRNVQNRENLEYGRIATKPGYLTPSEFQELAVMYHQGAIDEIDLGAHGDAYEHIIKLSKSIDNFYSKHLDDVKAVYKYIHGTEESFYSNGLYEGKESYWKSLFPNSERRKINFHYKGTSKEVDSVFEERPSKAMAFVRTTDVELDGKTTQKSFDIYLDRERIKKTFETKAWNSPKVEGVEPLNYDFKNVEEWEDFIVYHELSHVMFGSPIKNNAPNELPMLWLKLIRIAELDDEIDDPIDFLVKLHSVRSAEKLIQEKAIDPVSGMLLDGEGLRKLMQREAGRPIDISGEDASEFSRRRGYTEKERANFDEIINHMNLIIHRNPDKKDDLAELDMFLSEYISLERKLLDSGSIGLDEYGTTAGYPTLINIEDEAIDLTLTYADYENYINRMGMTRLKEAQKYSSGTKDSDWHNYLTRIWNKEEISKNIGAFLDFLTFQLTKHYGNHEEVAKATGLTVAEWRSSFLKSTQGILSSPKDRLEHNKIIDPNSRLGTFERKWDFINKSDLYSTDFVIKDFSKIAHQYVNSSIADAEFFKKFNTISVEEVVERYRAEMIQSVAKKEGYLGDDGLVSMSEMPLNILEEIEKDLHHAKIALERVRGIYMDKWSPVPGSAPQRLLESARLFNNITIGDGFGIGSFVDIGRPIVFMGLSKGIGALLKQFSFGNARSLEMIGEANRQLKAMMVGNEINQQILISSMTNVNMNHKSYSTIENLLENANEAMFIVNGLNYWNQSIKRSVGMAVIDTIIENSRLMKLGTLSKEEELKMLNMHLDKEDMLMILDQYEKYGTEYRGIHLLNFDNWDLDSDVYTELFERLTTGVRKEVDKIIMTPGMGDTHILIENEVVKNIVQYKSFMIAATNQTLIPLTQQGMDIGVISGLLTSALIGSAIAQYNAYVDGRNYDSKDWASHLWSALEDSAVIGHFGVAANLANDIFDANPYALGPTVTAGVDIARVASSIGREPTPSEVRSLNRTIPFANFMNNFIRPIETISSTSGEIMDEALTVLNSNSGD